MSAEAEVAEVALTPRDAFFIAATDGLWDRVRCCAAAQQKTHTNLFSSLWGWLVGPLLASLPAGGGSTRTLGPTVCPPPF